MPNPDDYKKQSILTQSIQGGGNTKEVSAGYGIKRVVATEPAPSRSGISGPQPVKKATAPGPQPVKKATAPGPQPVKKAPAPAPKPVQTIQEKAPAPAEQDMYYESEDEDDLTGWNS